MNHYYLAQGILDKRLRGGSNGGEGWEYRVKWSSPMETIESWEDEETLVRIGRGKLQEYNQQWETGAVQGKMFRLPYGIKAIPSERRILKMEQSKISSCMKQNIVDVFKQGLSQKMNNEPPPLLVKQAESAPPLEAKRERLPSPQMAPVQVTPPVQPVESKMEIEKPLKEAE